MNGDGPLPAPDVVLDLRGLKCPLPVLRTRKALAALDPGMILAVRCTDPLSAIDLPHLLRQSGDALLSKTIGDGDLTFLVRKAGPAGV